MTTVSFDSYLWSRSSSDKQNLWFLFLRNARSVSNVRYAPCQMNSKRTDRIPDPPIRTCWAIRWLRAARKSAVGKCVSLSWQIGRQWFIDTIDCRYRGYRLIERVWKIKSILKTLKKYRKYLKLSNLDLSSKLVTVFTSVALTDWSGVCLSSLCNWHPRDSITFHSHSASLWSWNGLNQAHSVTLFLYESLRVLQDKESLLRNS